MHSFNEVKFNPGKQESGYVLIAILTVLFMLGAISLVLAKAVFKNQTEKGMESSYVQAHYTALGGLEWAKNQINQGKNPTVTQKAFGQGSLTVTIEPAVPLVHSTATVG